MLKCMPVLFLNAFHMYKNVLFLKYLSVPPQATSYYAMVLPCIAMCVMHLDTHCNAYNNVILCCHHACFSWQRALPGNAAGRVQTLQWCSPEARHRCCPAPCAYCAVARLATDVSAVRSEWTCQNCWWLFPQERDALPLETHRTRYRFWQ